MWFFLLFFLLLLLLLISSSSSSSSSFNRKESMRARLERQGDIYLHLARTLHCGLQLNLLKEFQRFSLLLLSIHSDIVDGEEREGEREGVGERGGGEGKERQLCPESPLLQLAALFASLPCFCCGRSELNGEMIRQDASLSSSSISLRSHPAETFFDPTWVLQSSLVIWRSL